MEVSEPSHLTLPIESNRVDVRLLQVSLHLLSNHLQLLDLFTSQ